MAIGLKTVWTLRIAPRHQSTVRGLTTQMNSNTIWPGLNCNAVWLKIILCDACTVRETFCPLICYHVTIRIVTPHQSMPHHRSMPHYRSICVNSVVNSSMENTVHVSSVVHVNNYIFTFMLFLRFSTVLSSKVISVWSVVHCEMTIMPLKCIKYLIKIKHT